MNYSAIKPVTIENGTGIRVSLFVSGCRRHCEGCHNPEAWDFSHGKEFDNTSLKFLLEMLGEPYVTGLSILGGEPFEPENESVVFHILSMVRQVYGKTKNVWIYSGFRYEEIKDSPILKHCDYLVDGEFIQDLKNLNLPFRGSENQRIIDLKKTLKTGEVVLRPEDKVGCLQ